MSKTEKTVSSETKKSILDQANMVHALSYIPFFIGAIAMYFLGNTDKKAAMHHIKYSLMLSIAATLLFVILSSFFGYVLNMAYIGLSVYFGLKAYKGEAVEVEILDVIEDKIQEKIKK